MSYMLATIREEMGSTLKEEWWLFKREMRGKFKAGLRLLRIKLKKKVPPTPLPRYSLFFRMSKKKKLTTIHGKR